MGGRTGPTATGWGRRRLVMWPNGPAGFQQSRDQNWGRTPRGWLQASRRVGLFLVESLKHPLAELLSQLCRCCSQGLWEPGNLGGLFPGQGEWPWGGLGDGGEPRACFWRSAWCPAFRTRQDCSRPAAPGLLGSLALCYRSHDVIRDFGLTGSVLKGGTVHPKTTDEGMNSDQSIGGWVGQTWRSTESVWDSIGTPSALCVPAPSSSHHCSVITLSSHPNCFVRRWLPLAALGTSAQTWVGVAQLLCALQSETPPSRWHNPMEGAWSSGSPGGEGLPGGNSSQRSGRGYLHPGESETWDASWMHPPWGAPSPLLCGRPALDAGLGTKTVLAFRADQMHTGA